MSYYEDNQECADCGAIGSTEDFNQEHKLSEMICFECGSKNIIDRDYKDD